MKVKATISYEFEVEVDDKFEYLANDPTRLATDAQLWRALADELDEDLSHKIPDGTFIASVTNAATGELLYTN